MLEADWSSHGSGGSTGPETTFDARQRPTRVTRRGRPDPAAPAADAAAYEPVHTGGPRFGRPQSGVADFRGVPHAYQCVGQALGGGDSDVYLLAPVAAERLRLEVALWQLFLQWCEALDAGRTDLGQDAVLPEHRAEHARLVARLRRLADPGTMRAGRAVHGGDAPPLGARAVFRQDADPAGRGLPGRWWVRWQPLPSP